MKPWRVRSWVIPEASAAFVCQMERVLGVYARPYDPARPVVCLDEKRKQLVRQERLPYIDTRGVRYEDYEYERASVGVLYLACEPLAGWRQVRLEASQDRLSWARVVGRLVEETYAEAERVTLVQDNLSVHTVATPVHGSWLNVAEIELSVLGRQALAQRIGSLSELEAIAGAWARRRTA